MSEAVTVRDGKFLRPKQRREGGEGEQFSTMLKKALHVSFHLLLLSSFLFLGHRVYAHLLEDPLFRVREVDVGGCLRLPQETLLSLAGVEGMPNLFTVGLKEIGRRLEEHPWVEGVVVRKAFPDRISIQVEERKPIAILQLDELYYIDAKGVIFSRVGEKDGYNYPFLTGLGRESMEKESEEAKGLVMKALELLLTVEKEKASPLGEISEIHMEKTSGVHCFTKTGGIEIKMGWDHFGEKLKRLAIVCSDLQKRGVSATSIDSSDLNRMVVRKVFRRGESGRR
jgi:cell division protein FtsQ